MKVINAEDLKLRKREIHGTSEQQRAVEAIIDQVKHSGDTALTTLTKKFDGVDLTDMRVTDQEIQSAYDSLDSNMVSVIQEAIGNIKSFHEKQVRHSWSEENDEGTVLGQKVTALDAVGVYVPGGTAAYPSSVLMGVIPALVAGVKRIVITSPPNKQGKLTPGILVAAHELGVKEIYKVGGAQAIAALAYGTETIQSVDKIVGPGNIYVAIAKRLVYGMVDIDSLAGPSEIAILADDTAHADWVAADLLSQAEHDPMAMAVLVTPSEQLANDVIAAVQEQLKDLPRKAIAERAIADYSKFVVVSDINQGVELINQIAPEHLEIVTEEPDAIIDQIRHAGAIFIGQYSSEPVGDYFAGPNHVIPTNGTARFSSPLNVDDFIKKSSIIRYSKQALINHGEQIAAFATYEGLDAHARAINIRLKGEK